MNQPFATFAFLTLVFCGALSAQARTFVVDNQNPHTCDTATGDTTHPLETINAAAQLAQAGDEVVVRAGTYRETVVPARGGEAGKPITYRAEKIGTVVVKGSELWLPQWTPVENRAQIFRAALPLDLLKSYNPFRMTAKTYDGDKWWGELYLNNVPLPDASVKDELDGKTLAWKVAPEGDAILLSTPGAPPRALEITTRAALFRPDTRGLGYITLRGFDFEQCANPSGEDFWKTPNPPQAGAVSTRSGHHWIIENNTIRFAQGIGLDCGREGLGRVLDGQTAPRNVGYHLIRGNRISDSGQCGIAGSGQFGTRIENNVVERSNRRHFFAYEEAGIKCHFFINGIIEGNLVRDNEADGLWLDNVWQGTTVRGNAFLNNRTSAVFLEMGRGPCLVQNNVLGWTRPGFRKDSTQGNGFYAHDASGFTVSRNLIINNDGFGVYLRTVVERSFPIFPADITSFDTPRLRTEKVGTSDITVEKNLIAGNTLGVFNLRLDDGTKGNVSDHNFLAAAPNGELRFQLNRYYKCASKIPASLLKVPLTLEQWRTLTGHDTASTLVTSSATMTNGVKPRIVVRTDPQIALEFPTDAGNRLPYELELNAHR